MPFPTFGSSLYTFIVTVPSNAGAFVSLYSLLTATQKLALNRSAPGYGNVGGISQIRAAQVTLRPTANMSVSYKAWASAAAAVLDTWTVAATVADEFPVDDAMNSIFVQSQSGSTLTLEIRLFGQASIA